MNDTIDSCKCACHENRPPMNTDGLAHDNACCDEMNGQLEWCEVKRLIAKAVVEAKIDELKHLVEDGGIWYQDMTRQFPQKITLNQRIKELE